MWRKCEKLRPRPGERGKKTLWREPVVVTRVNFVLDPGRERMRVRGGAAVTLLTLNLNIDVVSISYFGVKV